MDSPFLKSIRSTVDNHIEFMEKYNEIMRKQDRETLRRKLKTRQVSAEGISAYISKCEAMDEIMNLFEKRSSRPMSSGQISSDNDASETAAGKKLVLRKGGYTKRLDEILEEVEKNRRERGLDPDIPSSSSSHNHGLEIVAEKLSVLGMGGIGETTVHNNGSTNNYTFGTVQMTNYYHHRKTTMDDESE